MSTKSNLYTEMDPVKNLIQMVKERRAIWDKACDDYRDKSAKDRAWIEIYRQMEPSYDTLQHMMKNQIGSQITKKWYNVRDSYRKSVKSNYGIKRPRPYIYADQLTFLDSIMEKTIEENANDTEEEQEQGTSMNQVFVDMDEEFNVPSKRQKFEEFASRDTGEKLGEDIVSVLANIIQKEEDEDRSFFKSIIPSVKRLSEDSKIEFRIQVMKLMRKLRMRDKVGANLKDEIQDDDTD